MKFYKEGIVTINANDGDNPWTFENPTGEALSVHLDFTKGTAALTIKVNDHLNEVVKTYTIPMDAQMGGNVFALFENDIRRIAKETYPEFVGLEEVASK